MRPAFCRVCLTNDVERLEPGEACYAALLTPQGKILFDMIVVRAPDAGGAAFLLDCTAAQAADLAKRLGFYKLRAKVAVADESADPRRRRLLGRRARRRLRAAFSTPTRAIRASAGARSCRARSRPPSDRSTRASTRACASASSRRRAASISPTATPSRTTPISTFCMASISTRAAMSARRSFRA